MDTVPGFRKKTDQYVLPVVRVLDGWNVHPNVLTLIAFVCGLLAVVFLFEWWLFVLFAVLHLVFDKLDGALARSAKKQSVFGRWLDHGSDRLVELFVLVRLMPFSSVVLLLFLLFGIQNVLYLRTRTEMFYGRTILLIGVALQLYSSVLVVVGVWYGVGWSCR